MTIDFPLASLRSDSVVLFRLTVGDLYLILATEVVDRLEAGRHSVYWRFMARQLRRLGLSCDGANAWCAFAD